MNAKNQRPSDLRKMSLCIAVAAPRNLILDNILYMNTELPTLAAPEDFKELLVSLLSRLYDSVTKLVTVNDLLLQAIDEDPTQLDAIKRRNLLVLEILHREIHVMDAVVRYLFGEADIDDESDIGSISILVSESMVNIFTAYGELHTIIHAACDPQGHEAQPEGVSGDNSSLGGSNG